MAANAGTLLETYRRKRDFARTAEPKGARRPAARGKAGQPRFVVQKHDASRLHYDFRLELDGVLKSWAVTRGPSLNPSDKRLAVRVEDHPLDYAGFEGTIPDGEYGGGTVMLWDEGTWEPIGDPHEGLDKGDLKFRLHGRRMKGEWVLVHMKGRDSAKRENWLLIKHRDRYASETEDLIGQFTTSVETGRDLSGIAQDKPARRRAGTRSSAPAKASTTKATSAKTPSAKTPSAMTSSVKTRSAAAGRPTTSRGKSGLPAYRPPELATLVDRVPEGRDWLFEMKYDGYRCLAAIAGAEVQLFTRNGNDWTEQFGAIRPALAGLTTGSALIDGELCAFKDGRTDFSALKQALSTGGALVYFAFDLLEQDGEDLGRLPLGERKARLRALLGEASKDAAIQYSDHVEGHGEQVYETMCRGGFEGVIAKRADSPYRGDRTRDWLKIKCLHRQEFVIGGWRPSTRRNRFASLLLGAWEGDRLVYHGRVGTGFNERDAAELQAALDARARATSPLQDVPRTVSRAARWVKPELVAEIAFTEFTPDGALRHPSFVGLRQDKKPREVVLEKPAAPPAGTPAAKPSPRPVSGPPNRQAGGSVRKVDIGDAAGVAAAERLGVRLTHPDRVSYPGQGITKGTLAAYYAAVGEAMLPHIAGRPLSLVRCPQGRARHCFFQKHDTGAFPDAMKTLDIVEKDGSKEAYYYIEDVAGLIAGVQMNVLEFHIWGSHGNDIERPDRIVFDIDPDEGLDFGAVRDAAVDLRDVLKAVGLTSFPMVTGGKGIHVVAPLRPDVEWPQAKSFCKAIATRLAEAEPDRYVANMAKARRKGRMFIDYLRNERGSTAIAPYSTRSREGAPVATPLEWSQVKTLVSAHQFSLSDAAARAAGADPWAGYFDLDQTITGDMLKAVGAGK